MNLFPAATLGALVLACAATMGPPADPTPLTLGTFDSRALAIAYTGSEAFQAHMADLHQQLADAHAADDTARVSELEALGPAMQARLHGQGFSTAPVDDLLEHIEDALPGIAADAGVDVIVSKWDLTYEREGLVLVDVTVALAARFEPDERTWTSIREIMRQEPVALEELQGH